MCLRARRQLNRKKRVFTSRFPDFFYCCLNYSDKNETQKTDFNKNENFDASKRADERQFGRMAKRICEKNEKNDDEDGFGSTHFGG